MFDDGGRRLALLKVRQIVLDLAARIGAPSQDLPTFGISLDGGHPHVEVDQRYHLVTVERGEELERRSTEGLDELLFWVFESVTFSMAVAYELVHRRRGQDFRRILFQRQLELLAGLDGRWAERQAADLEATLARHPFTDRKPPGLQRRGW